MWDVPGNVSDGLVHDRECKPVVQVAADVLGGAVADEDCVEVWCVVDRLWIARSTPRSKALAGSVPVGASPSQAMGYTGDLQS